MSCDILNVYCHGYYRTLKQKWLWTALAAIQNLSVCIHDYICMLMFKCALVGVLKHIPIQALSELENIIVCVQHATKW